MTRSKKIIEKSKKPNLRQCRLLFRLYISSGGASSERAIANLEMICEKHFQNNYELEVVDALQDPLRAAKDGVEVTPTLVKASPLPRWKIEGDLSDDALILAALRGDDKGRRARRP
jgi:circadian clock protein KaiB